jgi:hypothetical protein
MPAIWHVAPAVQRQISFVFSAQHTPVPPAVWEAIMLAESRGNPAAVNLADPGGSYGLFQLNRYGQGEGYTVAELQNPLKNAEIAAPPISKAYQQALQYGYIGNAAAIYTATHSGHPGYAATGRLGASQFPTEAQAVSGYYSKLARVPQTDLSTLLPAVEAPTNASGRTVPFWQAQRLPTAAQSSKPTGVWATMLQTMDRETRIGPWLALDPARMIRGVLYMVVVLVLAILLIAMGLKTLVMGQ